MTLASLLSEDIYCHSNGLKHINTIDKKAFSALFVVNTPVFDNTGVAHGVEHMVFRGSKAFPHPETLFQLTSLTDVKINASTLAQKTYFHCQSQCPHTFMLAINYLLNGLFTPDFSYKDLQCEIHDGNNKGVVYHELKGLEQVQSKSSQKNKQCDFYYGGKSELIGELTLQDLTHYHQRFYRASNMTLITANADVKQISSLITLLPKQHQVTNEIGNIINKYGTKPKKIKAHKSDKKKYSPAINKLITLYDLWLKDPYYQEIYDYNEIDAHTKIDDKNKINDDTKKNHTKEMLTTNAAFLPLKNNSIPSLLILSNTLLQEENNTKLIKCNTKSVISHVTLPSLFEELFQKAKKKLIMRAAKPNTKTVFVCTQNNTLWLSKINENEQVIAIITSYIISAYPIFLAPRCQGSCYATQALVIDHLTYLAIYSAFDANPDTRSEDISQILLNLSQDSHFIRENLALAKIKYCRVNQVQYGKLKTITATNIAAYIKNLLM